MNTKRTVAQSVFDSPEAKKLIKKAFAEVDKERDALFRAGGPFQEGDPNHPMYNQSSNNPTHLFGYPTKEFLSKQMTKPTRKNTQVKKSKQPSL